MRPSSLAVGFLLSSLSVFASAVGCAPHAQYSDAFYAQAARDDPRRRPYEIGIADVVRITVWKDPNLSTDASVRPDGTVTMPLAGEFRAAGRTAAELQKDISTRLESYVKDAVVTVALIEVNSYRFTVAGNVEHPGMFTSRYYVTVSEALALAGGPNRYASTSDVVLVRSTNGHRQRVAIDYDKILSGDRPDEDVVVLAGDAIQVP
ncbi:MAG TPA: polysaccharide biosynthesis/export family protein [Polyangiaceae bacterium]|jgi:polysaccharide export outer membrane protein|nr:polysaccharide biosynthesis/export family protein [Polyangiaceae bacterium]